MKLIHSGDWHLGKLFNGFSLIEDQKFILNQLFDILKHNNANILIISGDIYDRSIPPQDTIKLLDDFIFKVISNLNIKIFIIPGNHDSAQRLSFANKLFSEKGLFIAGDFNKKIPKVTLYDEFGPLNFFLLPFFNPTQIAKMFENDNLTAIKTFNDAFFNIINFNKAFIDLNSRNILITHGFFGYLNTKNNIFYDQITSESELSVGGADIIDISPASFFDYIALGHLHAPQKVYQSNFRYSGSILKYSVDEHNHKKSCVYIDFKEKNNLSFELIPLAPLRDLRIVTGYLKDFCECDESLALISNDYVFVELLDKDPIFDVVPRLRQTFKNLVGIKMTNRHNKDNNIIVNHSKNKDLKNLFHDFYNNVSSQELDQEKLNIISNVISELINSEK